MPGSCEIEYANNLPAGYRPSANTMSFPGMGVVTSFKYMNRDNYYFEIWVHEIFETVGPQIGGGAYCTIVLTYEEI